MDYPMLTVFHPEAILLIRDIPIGIIPFHFKNDRFPTLVIKAPKEAVLASKLKQEFKIYVTPINIDNHKTIGLISAFFDNEDEPLIICTPLFEEPNTDELLKLLLSKSVNVYFFDENSTEYLGYEAKISCNTSTLSALKNSKFLPFKLSHTRSTLDQMTMWFGLRSYEDDLSAIKLSLGKSLAPEDIFILDLIPQNHLYHGSEAVSFTKLVRKEPGSYQERDIVCLLHRLFRPEQIYLNPLRVTDREEIADIIVVTEKNILLIQAKDSPNTESIIQNTVERKKATTIKNLKKAINQTKGSLRYINSNSSIKMIIDKKEKEIKIGNRTLRTLVVVKELFNDGFSIYSSLILSSVKLTKVPCIALDYSELNIYTSNLVDEFSFFEAYDRVSNYGIQNGVFPRLRILPGYEE
jgi:hypothetical protein